MYRFFAPLLLLLVVGTLCEAEAAAIKAVVGIAPYCAFVKRIGGDYVEAIAVVPAGVSSHSYEPTSRQILEATKADIWFTLGEPFEKKALQAITSYRNHLLIIDLRQGIELIGSCCHASCHTTSADPHIWLVPPLVKIQAKLIATALSTIAPTHKKFFEDNFNALAAELDALDAKIHAVTDNLSNRTFLTAHPSYSYFASHYALTQLSLEVEGRDPSAQQLSQLLQQARAAHIRLIFVQPQHPSKGAKLIAQQLQAHLISLDPYAEDYFGAMEAFLVALHTQDLS